MAKEKATDTRSRSWVAVVYPDSAPENWRQILDEEHIEWAESPLHEFDTNPDGEVKKAHWHIALSFEGKKSFEQVQELLAPLNCPIPKRCHSLRGAVRYFAHLDNPEKYQYRTEDIVAHGGFDVAAMLLPTSSQRYEVIDQMITWVRDNGIIEYKDLMDYASAHRREDWFPLLCDSCTIVMQQYIKSQRHGSGLGGPPMPKGRGDPEKR